MMVGTVKRLRHQAPAAPGLIGLALLLAGLGALVWSKLPEQLSLALRGDPHVVEQVLPRAQAGDPAAQHDLGLRYAGGRGVPRDAEGAVKWYRAAAEQGYGPAQSGLGLAYYWGEGVEQDHLKAAEWLRRAADRGIVGAQYMLGLMHQSGKGVPKDPARAAHWQRRAAEQGNHYAQHVLARLLRDGTGVPRDPVEAYKWLELAIPKLKPSPARESWVKMRQQLAQSMTPAQIAEAKRRARAWRPAAR